MGIGTISKWLGGGALTVAAVVLVAWLARVGALVEPWRSEPLDYSTAFAAAWVALGVVLASFGRRWAGSVAALVGGAVAALSLVQNLAGTTLIPAGLLDTDFLDATRVSPGRMSSATALALLCLSQSVPLVQLGARSRWLLVSGGCCAALGFAVGVTGGVGFLTHVALDSSWDAFHRVSPTGSLILTLIGASSLLQGWAGAAPGRHEPSPVYALPVLAGALTVTGMMYASFEYQERARLAEFANLRAVEAVDALNRRSDAVEDAVLRIALLMSEQREVEPHEWTSTVARNSKDLPGLVLFDIESHGVRSVSPPVGPERRHAEAVWRAAFEGQHAPVGSGVLESGGMQYLWFAAAVTGSTGHRVRAVALFEPRPLVESALPHTIETEYTSLLWHGPTLLYESPDRGGSSDWAEYPVGPDAGWRLRLKPSDTFLRSRRGEAPVTALLAGTICSALLAAAAHLTLVARGRAAESRRANQELAESREFLAQLVASLPEAVLTVAADGRIEKVDGAAPQVLARSGASIVGRNVDEFIGLDPGGTKLRQTKKQSGMESLVGTVVDAEVFGQDGQCIYAVIRITAFNTAAGRKYLWTVTDIQWRRQAEQENRRLVEALRRKNDDLQTALDEARDNAQRFEALLESSPEATLLVDEAGRILEFNRRARELLGYTRDEALAGSVEMLVPPEIRPRHAGIRENYMRAPDNRMMARGRDLVAIAKDGTRIPVEINLSPLRFRGRVLVAASLIDLRERLRVADELRTSERRLRAANKELESIVYVASHDMRSPLVNLQGFSRQLAGAVKKLEPLLAQLPPEARAEAEAVMAQEVPEALTFISSSTRKMDGLIKGLLRLSRLGRAPLQMAEVDMNHLVAETVRNTQFVINERGIQVEVADLPRCWGDEIQLGQVFSNIVDNAIKYLDPARSGRVRVTGRVAGDYAVYEVEDNGIGIAPDHQAQVFEIFHRLAPDGDVPGEGLGLAVVRRILDRHDGDVRLVSTPGQGSRFIVILPRRAGARAASEVQLDENS